jgi:hypothetical protein
MKPIIFSCDSSSIRDNVRRSVGLSVGRSVGLSLTSFKKSRMLIYYQVTIEFGMNNKNMIKENVGHPQFAPLPIKNTFWFFDLPLCNKLQNLKYSLLLSLIFRKTTIIWQFGQLVVQGEVEIMFLLTLSVYWIFSSVRFKTLALLF